MEMVIQAAFFFSIGILCRYWSRRAPLPGYAVSKIPPLEYFFFALGLGFDSLVTAVLQPVGEALFVAFPGFIQPIRDAFAGTNPFVQLAGFLVVADFLSYWVHRFMHTRWLWPAHAFHHSAKALNWVSGMRGSLPHYFIVGLPYYLLFALTLLSAQFSSFYMLVAVAAWSQHTIHSGIDWPHARRLENFIVTPAMHFVHHHPNPKYTDSNFGLTFALWDKIFGTYTNPEHIEASQRGVTGLDYEIGLKSLIAGVELPGSQRVYPQVNRFKKSA